MRAVAPGPDGRPNSCRCRPANSGPSRRASSRSPGSTRHSKVTRWRWTDEVDPVKVEHAVGKLIERRDWTMLSHRVIFHGRRVCHARKPACGVCLLARDCPSFGAGPTDPVEAAKLVKGPRAAEIIAQAQGA